MAMIAAEKDGPTNVPVPGRVVGIDPGLNVTGYAVVEPSSRGPFVVEAGVIRPRCPRRDAGPAAGLDLIRAFVEVLEQHIPARLRSSSSTATCGIPGRPS